MKSFIGSDEFPVIALKMIAMPRKRIPNPIRKEQVSDNTFSIGLSSSNDRPSGRNLVFFLVKC